MKDKRSVEENVIKFKTLRNFNGEKPIVITIEKEVTKEEYELYKQVESSLDQLEFPVCRNRYVYQVVLLEAIKKIEQEKNYIEVIDQFQNPNSEFYEKIDSKYKIEDSYNIVLSKYQNCYATTPGNTLFGMAQYIMIERNRQASNTINKNFLKQQAN